MAEYRSGTHFIGCEHGFYKMFSSFFLDLPQSARTCTCNCPTRLHGASLGQVGLADERVSPTRQDELPIPAQDEE